VRRAALRALLLVAAISGCAGPGSVDLRIWTLHRDGMVDLAIRLPAHLDRDLPARRSRYTLTTTVDVPPELRGRVLTVSIAHLDAVAHLYVAGEEAPELAASMWDRYRRSTGHLFWIGPRESQASRLELALVVEYPWLRSGWFDVPPRLAAGERGDAWFALVSLLTLWSAALGLASTLVIGVLYLIIYLGDRRRTSHGWFALGTFAAIYYPLFMIGVTQPLFGIFDGSLLAFTTSLTQVAAIHFVHAQFQLPNRPSRLWLIAFLVGAAILFALRNPFVASRYIPIPCCAFVAVVMAHNIRTLWALTRRRPRPTNAHIVLVSAVVLLLFASTDFASWLGFGIWLGGLRAGSLGLTVFVLLQAGALSRQHASTLAQTDELNRELQARLELLQASKREVDLLVGELRRQIESRSHQLALALGSARSTSPRAAPLQPGALIEQRFRVLRVLGAGGMGTVYEVERLVDDRRFALKMVSAKAEGAVLARFAREAEIAAQIDHPNVVAIVDIDVTQGGELFLVMELVSGSTLEDQRDRYGDVDWALAVLHQTALGLAAIHGRGVVHRDLKPANVLLMPAAASGMPRVKIADFGIASLRTGHGIDAIGDTLLENVSDDARLTKTGTILGTPMYMAPELLRGARSASPKSDVYAFGLIAYQLLSREFPPREHGPNRSEALAPRPIGVLCPQIPAELAGLLDRCLSPAFDERPTIATLVTALADAVGRASAARAAGVTRSTVGG
jgi:serine/threonine-protein kinase